VSLLVLLAAVGLALAVLLARRGWVAAPSPAAPPTALSASADPNRSAAAPAPADEAARPAGLKLMASAAPLPSTAVRYAGVASDGTAWFRAAPLDASQPDTVVAVLPSGAKSHYPDLRTAVERDYAVIRAAGSMADFWGVDADGRVWIGPAYFDGQRWTEVAATADQAGGRVSYEDRVLVDSEGTAWVPYRLETDCVVPGGCAVTGLAGFKPDGATAGSLTFERPPDVDRLGLDSVFFAQRDATLSIACAPKAFYGFPGAQSFTYPGLRNTPGSGSLNSGYATAVTIAPSGAVEAFAWKQQTVDASPGTVTYSVTIYRWTGSQWQWTALTDGPLFAGRARNTVVTAAAYAPDGGLWLASSGNELAQKRGDAWVDYFTPANSPLGAPIHDLAVGGDGTLWVATAKGVLALHNGVWRTGFQLYLPVLRSRD